MTETREEKERLQRVVAESKLVALIASSAHLLRRFELLSVTFVFAHVAD